MTLLSNSTAISPRHGFDSCSDDRLRRCGVMAYVEETSGSAKLSGHNTYGMAPCRTNYRSGYTEQFTETHASGLVPAWDQGVTQVKGRNGPVNLNIAHGNQFVTLPIWGG
eukprot:7996396-Ditylum_brightwellii.AAC.1